MYNIKDMTARKRLSRYFELVHNQSKLTTDEFKEMCHLEEALVDDMNELDQFRKEQIDGRN